VNALRRTLYLQAAVWAAAGLALAAFPRFVVVVVFDQPEFPAYAWLRVLGVQSFGLAMLMVLVAHRLEELWWWTWAFALVNVATAAVVLMKTAFGVSAEESPVVWWLFSAVSAGFSGGLLYGLYISAQEHPLP
jgi:hypothetical protein